MGLGGLWRADYVFDQETDLMLELGILREPSNMRTSYSDGGWFHNHRAGMGRPGCTWWGRLDNRNHAQCGVASFTHPRRSTSNTLPGAIDIVLGTVGSSAVIDAS
jgi:hypothetical protein